MSLPEQLKYSKEHTWLFIDGNQGTIGITEFAQSELGEIVYVDLPNIGNSYQQDEVFGSVEALKTTSDLFMPSSGKIIEINTMLKYNPTLVNTDPYVSGWLIKITLSTSDSNNQLLSASDYQKLIS